MKRKIHFLIFVLSVFLTSCASKPPKVIKQIVRDTIVVNKITDKYEYARFAKLDNYVVSTKHYPALGQDERIRFLILHYTAMDNEPSIRVLTNNEVSSHYLITDLPNDTIYALVDETKRSWHAGASFWKGVNNLNFSSIGIEIVNKGYTTDNTISGNPDLVAASRTFYNFPEYQIRKVAELCRDIIDRYKIDPVNVLAHSDIAPQRKHDPGPKFPWKKLYDEYNIGAWYEEHHKSMFYSQFPYDQKDSYSFILSVQTDLETYGYEIQKTGTWDEQTKKVIAAFQYHFRPERYDGVMDVDTWSILKALNLKYRNK